MFEFLLRDEAGQGQMEYALTLAFVVLMVLGALRLISDKTTALLHNVASGMPESAGAARP